MKKFLGGGKIWTILSALMFFMTCGVFVLGAGGGHILDPIIETITNSRNFSNWNVENLDKNQLSAESWNKLIDDLQEWSVPEGAIMAFHLTKCPDGWSVYKPANGKFLKGDSSILTNKQNLGIVGGTPGNKVTLTKSQLAPHEHYMFGGSRDSAIGSYGTYNGYIAYHTDDGGNEEYRVSRASKDTTSPIVGLTSSVGNGSPINIENENVHVLYCIKNSKPKEEGPINGDDIDVKHLCKGATPVNNGHITIGQSWSSSSSKQWDETSGLVGECQYKCDQYYSSKTIGNSIECVNNYNWTCVLSSCTRNGQGVVCDDSFCGKQGYTCNYRTACINKDSGGEDESGNRCLDSNSKVNCEMGEQNVFEQ